MEEQRDIQSLNNKMGWDASRVYDYIHDKNLLIGYAGNASFKSMDIKAKKFLKKKPIKEFTYNKHRFGMAVEWNDFILYIDDVIIYHGNNYCGAAYQDPWRSLVNWILCSPGSSTPPFFICMINEIIGENFYPNGYRSFRIISENENGWIFFMQHDHKFGGSGWTNKNRD